MYQRVKINNSNFNQNTFFNWPKIKHCVPKGSILGLSLFLCYINDLPKVAGSRSTPIVYADYISNLITSSNSTKYKMISTFWRRNYFFNFSTPCI